MLQDLLLAGVVYSRVSKKGREVDGKITVQCRKSNRASEIAPGAFRHCSCQINQ